LADSGGVSGAVVRRPLAHGQPADLGAGDLPGAADDPRGGAIVEVGRARDLLDQRRQDVDGDLPALGRVLHLVVDARGPPGLRKIRTPGRWRPWRMTCFAATRRPTASLYVAQPWP